MDYYKKEDDNEAFTSDATYAYLEQAFGHSGDIMYSSSNSAVSPLTAFSIGWRYNLDATIYNNVYPYTEH